MKLLPILPLSRALAPAQNLTGRWTGGLVGTLSSVHDAPKKWGVDWSGPLELNRADSRAPDGNLKR